MASEADTRANYIDPALRAADWQPSNIIREHYFTDIRIVPNTEMVQPGYLGLFLRYPAYWGIVKANAVGAAQPNINGTKLSEFKVPTPKLEVQRVIIDEMTCLSDRVIDLKKEQKISSHFWNRKNLQFSIPLLKASIKEGV